MPVRYKKFGNQEYAYEIWNEKDPGSGRWRQRSKYLGVVVDKEKGAYEKPNERRYKQAADERRESCILDYGDSYLLHEIIAPMPIMGALKEVFGSSFNTLMPLVFHRITGGGAMRFAEDWYEGNYVSRLFPGADVKSQGISRFLSRLGDESVQRAFFSSYISAVRKDRTSVVIDSTGLPNEVDMPVTGWGCHNGGIEHETRLILAVDRESGHPLYYRYVAGGIGDVSTLANTIAEMKKNGISTSSALVDAGYYSEGNLRMLFAAKINFLVRMPSNRAAYKGIISRNTDIESPKYAVKYNKRGLFVKENEVEVYGERAFAYLVLDSERRGREISKGVLGMDEDADADGLDFSSCGKLVLLSSERLPPKDVIPLYYMRQIAERMFGIAKDDLGILPLRIHSEPNFKGFMLLVFIALVLACEVKTRLGKKVSVEQAVSALRNLKCKVYGDSVIVGEVTKKQRLILETADVLVPKVKGI